MLGKRTRPTMRRTTSMSQLGSASNIEKIGTVKEKDVVIKEKHKMPFSIPPQLKPPAPGSTGTSAPTWRNIPKKHTLNWMVINPYQTVFGDGALAEGMGMVYPNQGCDTVHEQFHNHNQGQGQFQAFSGHSGVQSCPSVGNSSTMGRANGSRGDQGLHRTNSIPSSPRRGYGVQMIEPANFLQACFLCKRRLGHGRDIYMYRDDRAFCSVECREQQILIDDRKEKQSFKVMTTGSGPSVLYQNIGMNGQSGTAKSIQSERRAAA